MWDSTRGIRRPRLARRILLAHLALAAVLLGCGDGAEEPTDDAVIGDDAEGAADDGEDVADGDSADSDAGTFRMALPTIISNIDPAVYEGTPSTEVEGAWSAALYEFVDPDDVADDELGRTGLDSVEPFLVASDEDEEDGSIVVTLQEGIESAYGNELTSEDVAWTIDRALENDFVAQFVLSVGRVDPEDPIEVIDDHSFRVNVTQPSPFTRAVLTLWNLSPLDSTEAQEHATDEDPWASEWLSQNSATFGPYHVANFSPGEQVQLESNPGWPLEQPAYGEVVMQQVPEASSRLQLLSRGEIEYAQGLQPEQFADAEEEGSIRTGTRIDNRIIALELNFRFEPFQDERVRQAIAHAIDREAMVEGPMRGFATEIKTQILSGLDHPEQEESYEYDPDEARRLLEEAGYADDLEFPIAINLTRPGPYAEQIAVLLDSQLGDVGIDVDIQTIASSADFEEQKEEGQLTAWLGANTPMVPDTWYFLQLEHHSTDAFQNWKAYEDPEFDDMIGELRDLPVGDERDELISTIHDHIMETVPWVPIMEPQMLIAVSDDVDVDSVRQYTPYGPIVREIRPG